MRGHNVELGENQRMVHNPRWNGGRRIREDGYINIRVDVDNPYRSMLNSDGYILEHRLVMAKHLKRPLTSEEVVHHMDGDRANNNLTNLLLTTRGKHLLSYRQGYEQGYKDACHKFNAHTGEVDVQRSK